MTDKLNELIKEDARLKDLIEKSDSGSLFAGSLFRLALSQPEGNVCRTAAEAYVDIMEKMDE